ncbi:tRNA (adenosine(37)-N6)-dimethylallyltransferase MiaA, partial [bacterium]|nr:tRNA (adenosine(37)-N6)-dimethylallyltransferase MiaA [bacterium]
MPLSNADFLDLDAVIEPVVMIVGPTAIGKSDLAISLARRWGADIISADAFQVYRHMDIGTAKVSAFIRQEIPHHLIDICDPDVPYSVKQFVDFSVPFIEKAKATGKRVIVCGGTGLYNNALLYNYQFPAQPDNLNRVRERLEVELSQNGPLVLWNRLAQIDAAAAARIHPNHGRRIVRALEIVQTSGGSMAEARGRDAEKRSDIFVVGLTANRELIGQRIQDRVSRMVSDGLIEEVKGLLAKGYSPESQAFQALGYKETVAYLDGRI